MIEWSNDRMIEWSNDWMIVWLNDWMSEWLNDWMIEWSNDRMIEWSNDRMIEWSNDQNLHRSVWISWLSRGFRIPGIKLPKLNLLININTTITYFSIWWVALKLNTSPGLKECTWRLSRLWACPTAIWKLPETLLTSSTPQTIHPRSSLLSWSTALFSRDWRHWGE